MRCPPPGPQTRIGDALNTVLQTGATTPLSGIVIVTDGAENGGTLSEERLAELAAFGVPVHTVGVGPEQITNDLELDSITLANAAAPGEVLNAEVSIRHSAKGKTRLRVYDGEQLLAASEVNLSADAGVTTAPSPSRRESPECAICASHSIRSKGAEHHQQHSHAGHGRDAATAEHSLYRGRAALGVQVHSPRGGDGHVAARREHRARHAEPLLPPGHRVRR